MTNLDADYLRTLLKKRIVDSHKGNYGHSLLISGSKGKIGSAVLASRACLRSGAGLLTTHVPQCGVSILQQSIPEAIISIDSNEEFFSDSINPDHYDAIGIGPGIGMNDFTQQAFFNLLQACKKSMVIDADALNILSLNKNWFELIPKNSILTPHSKEFERLVGKWRTDEEKTERQISFSKEHQCVVVVKGSGTIISSPEGELFKNTTGNPGMAKGGSGDALTGMIAAFISQGYSAIDSALIGVCLHGLAGDIAAKKYSEYALLTSDLIENIPNAFNYLLLN
jgi:NAD(P)H-hydrate epimerase